MRCWKRSFKRSQQELDPQVNRRLGKCSIFEAKLWGILDGVTLVQGRQHDRILVQTNNMKVIGAIKEALSKQSRSTIIRHITQLLRSVENWSIQHVPREENAETDHIAKLDFDKGKCLQLYINSPFDSLQLSVKCFNFFTIYKFVHSNFFVF